MMTLIRDTLAGRREAYGDLVRRYKDSLYDMACRILHSKEEAEDALQDSLVEAYRHLKDFNHQSKFSTWLYSIVLNRVRNRLRRNKTIHWNSLDAPQNQDEDSSPQQIAEKGPTQIMELEHKLELDVVKKAVQLLPLEYKTIFILHYLQALPLQEVATRLDRPLGTVKVYLHRARQSLYKQLGAEWIKRCNLQHAS